jgi:hypothetical protein
LQEYVDVEVERKQGGLSKESGRIPGLRRRVLYGQKTKGGKSVKKEAEKRAKDRVTE